MKPAAASAPTPRRGRRSRAVTGEGCWRPSGSVAEFTRFSFLSLPPSFPFPSLRPPPPLPPSPLPLYYRSSHLRQRKHRLEPMRAASSAASISSAHAPPTETYCAADERTRRGAAPPSRTPGLFAPPDQHRTASGAFAAGRSAGWRCRAGLASAASPSRNRRPIARICPGTSVSRAIRSVARAAAIATVPHQNEPVTKTFAGGVAEPVIARDGGQRIAVGDGLAPGGEIRAARRALPSFP